jgi:hypothetical protein
MCAAPDSLAPRFFHFPDPMTVTAAGYTGGRLVIERRKQRMATTNPYSAWFGTADSANPFARAAQAQMDAMGEIARIGADAFRQVMKQQQDLFLAALGRWRDAAGHAGTGDASSVLELPLEAARVGTEIALQNANELAEIARRTQANMFAVLSARNEAAIEAAADAVKKTADEAVHVAGKAAAKAGGAAGATAEQVALASKLVE